MSLDVLSTACRQRHRPCGTRRVSTSTAYPAFECILAVVPHPLVSISETAGGHEGRWECQPHNASGFFFWSVLVPDHSVQCASVVPRERKKEKQTTQGRDGRTVRRHHTGILGEKCGVSRRPPSGVYHFLSLSAVSHQFSQRPSCHLAFFPLSSFSLLLSLPLTHCSPKGGKERKKENRQPKGGMGERHAATTQGF